MNFCIINSDKTSNITYSTTDINDNNNIKSFIEDASPQITQKKYIYILFIVNKDIFWIAELLKDDDGDGDSGSSNNNKKKKTETIATDE